MAKSKTVKGLDEFRKNVKRIRRDLDDAVEQALDDNANDLLKRAVALSPQLTGAHINSGRVVRLGRFVRSIQFDKPYSVRLHFARYKLGPISSRKRSTEDGRPGRLYLQRPFDRHLKRYTKEIGEAAADAFRRGLR